MSQTNALYQETIYDLSMRLYGDILGVSELVHNFTSLNDFASGVITYEEMEFPDFVAAEQPEEKINKITHIVREDQTIFDLSIQLTGKIDGMTEIISSFKSSIDEDLQGDTIVIDQNDDDQLQTIVTRGYLFSTRSIIGQVYEQGIFELNIFE